MAAVKMIYYMDVLSSWCTFVDGPLAKVRTRFGADLEFEWRIAALRDGKPLGYSPEVLGWYYKRSQSLSGTLLNVAWIESENDATWWPNVAAEAARSLGHADDTVRLALAKAGMVDGQHVQHRDVAEHVAATAAGLDPSALRSAMDDPEVTNRIHATTAEFRALPCNVVPTFVISNAIGDVNLLSGTFRYGPLAACVEQMLADATSYAAFGKAHPPPAAIKE
jgi:predicted DsbA family dithiol-disulfide isomerase